MVSKAIFLDRDGTINIDKGYVYKIEDFEFIEGTIEALTIFQNLGFKLIVISNQSGIERGYYTKEQADILFRYMEEELKNKGIIISKSYYCPHHKEQCNCRKPKLELFYKAQKELNINFEESYAIGDKLRDLAICDKEEVRGYLLNDNEKIENLKIQRGSSLLEVAQKIKDKSNFQGKHIQERRK